LLHLEFVAGHDAAVLPPKLVVRNSLLGDRHDLHVRSGVLLRPEADSPRLTGLYEAGFPGEAPYLTFRYQVVRVWQLPPGPFLEGGVALMPLALISAVTQADLPGIIQKMERRLAGPRRRKQAASVWAAAYIMAGLRYSAELSAQLFRGVVSMRESSTYQMILEEGRAEGELIGAVREAKKALRFWGDDAFGPPDAQTASRIEGLSDLEQLDALLKRVRTATSWQDLLGPLPPPRRGRRNSSS
jgi:hypothetical protein